MNNRPIGVFDSGLGGLTVLKELQKTLPNEKFIYIGDTAHVPYGNKSKESIYNFSKKIIDYLNTNNIKLIVAACNTVSSTILSDIKRITSTPIIDVITPLGDFFSSQNINKIGVIGTRNTIKSNFYNKLIKKYNSNSKIFSKACPMFVPIIESGLSNHKIARIMGEEYLKELIKEDIDFLVLGCTHYPLLKPMLKQILPKNIIVVDSASVTANYIHKYLLEKNYLSLNKASGKIEIKITDSSSEFNKEAKIFFDNKLSDIETISL